MIPLAPLLAAVALALVHFFAEKLRFLEGIPRSRWLSAAGGVSVAYVFLHLLPELSEGQELAREAADNVLSLFEHHIYIVALIGLSTFYGVEHAAQTAQPDKNTSEGVHNNRVFWLHVVTFSIYNAIIGYLLVHGEDRSGTELTLYTIAMALHFVVTDYGLRADHQAVYHQRGRYILVAAILVGWLLGALFEIPLLAVVTLQAFLAGGVILNVLKEELPEERQSSLSAFLTGVILYSIILIAI